MGMKSINVWLRGQFAGVLSDEDGRLSFSYDQSWIDEPNNQALSMGLPLVSSAFSEPRTRAYFDGLLPEAHMRTAVAACLDIDPADSFSLLQVLGRECLGAVQIMEDEPGVEGQIHWFEQEELFGLIDKINAEPLFAGTPYVSQTLPGELPVLAVIYDGQGIGLPLGDMPSTHIIEVAQSGYKDSVINRAFCADIAAAVGIPTVKPEVMAFGDDYVLMVPRNDRIFDGHSSIERFHVEDFAQAMGMLPTQKYQRNGGPDIVECLALMRRGTAGDETQVQQLLRRIVFDALIGNHRAHAKSYMLSNRTRTPSLAACQKVQTTAINVGDSRLLAMKIGDEQNFDHVKIHHWIRTTDNCGMTGKITRKLIEQLVLDIRASVPHIIEQNALYQRCPEIDAVLRLISHRTSEEHWGNLMV